MLIKLLMKSFKFIIIFNINILTSKFILVISSIKTIYYIKKINKYFKGDWGLGIGDWGLGIGPNPQSPIPNPQSPFYLLKITYK